MTDKLNQIINKATIAVTSIDKGNQYIPGVCNIGPSEREKRRVNALMGGMFAFSWPFLCFVFALPVFFKIAVFLPSIIGIINVLDYRQQFSAYFGLTNQYDFSPNGVRTKVLDKISQEKDQNKAFNTLMISLVVSFVYTLLVILLF